MSGPSPLTSSNTQIVDLPVAQDPPVAEVSTRPLVLEPDVRPDGSSILRVAQADQITAPPPVGSTRVSVGGGEASARAAVDRAYADSSTLSADQQKGMAEGAAWAQSYLANPDPKEFARQIDGLQIDGMTASPKDRAKAASFVNTVAASDHGIDRLAQGGSDNLRNLGSAGLYFTYDEQKAGKVPAWGQKALDSLQAAQDRADQLEAPAKAAQQKVDDQAAEAAAAAEKQRDLTQPGSPEPTSAQYRQLATPLQEGQVKMTPYNNPGGSVSMSMLLKGQQYDYTLNEQSKSFQIGLPGGAKRSVNGNDPAQASTYDWLHFHMSEAYYNKTPLQQVIYN
jgi:hypothetical protein